MKERIVELTITSSNPDLMETLRKQEDYHRALGYAMTWGDSDLVRIHVDKEGDLNVSHCRFIDKDKGYVNGNVGQYFFMLGLRCKKDTTGKYSFHS